MIERIWGTSINPPKQTDDDYLDNKTLEEYEDKDKPKSNVPNIKYTVDANGKLLHQYLEYNKILCSRLSLQMEDIMTIWRVTKHALGPYGTVAVTYDVNPCLNTMINKVEFPDGQLK